MHELIPPLARKLTEVVLLVGVAFVVVALIVGSLCAYMHRKGD